MASLEFAGDSGSLTDIDSTQGEFRGQLAALTDMVKQIVGDAAVSPGDTAQANPLNAPFTLYVNPYTGSDDFVGGSYNDYETGTGADLLASKLKRLEKQRLTCGFSPQRPFRTINRAAIEAAIITSKSWYTDYTDAGQVDCVSIVLSPGVHTVYNDPGSSSTNLTSWGTSKTPTVSDLIEFNPATVGGVLLPRGCSLCGADLRKITLRPNYVPPATDEASDYSNRLGLLKITGTGYFFGFTIMDKTGLAASHHLLDGFHFASKAELDAFYDKCEAAVGTGASLSSTLINTRGTEYQIVGPIDITQAPTSAWDTTSSASPYIFNISIRSNYGLGGAFMDGSKVEGLKSMVCANFTGVSLQKDMSCWQVYSSGAWANLVNNAAGYETYIGTSPNNVRMDPDRLSRHISAINNAVIQEVSVFAIGQGIHHFTDLGGEVTITNSNSSFGGCSALSKGYKSFPFPQDENWTVAKIKVPLNLAEKTNNIRRVFLGTVADYEKTVNSITLETALEIDIDSPTVPKILYKDDYSLKSGTRIWVENPTGDDWQTSLTASAWSKNSPALINVTGELTLSDTGDVVGTNPETGQSLAIGKRVYVRRLVDTRTPGERRMSLQLANTSDARIPERNFVIQTDPVRAGGDITRELTAGGSEVLTVDTSGRGSTTGVATAAEITLRRSAPNVNYAAGNYYRVGTVVRHNNKHFQALKTQTASGANPSPDSWGEIYVHMSESFKPEDDRRNAAPTLTLDTDTSSNANSTTLGINWATQWTSNTDLRTQYESATDYQGVYALLRALGFSAGNARSSLTPQTEAGRELDPNNQLTGTPSGGAATGLGNWAVEFRRPSVLRLYGHAWEWTGYLNYSKALPAAQKNLGAQNKFTYYFTNELGGRVVPQGSNEEGFNITPRGLEDVETGATISVESINNATIDDFQSTTFDNGLTASTITVGDLTVTGAVSFPETSSARTDLLGPVKLADAASYRSSDGISGTNDFERNTNISLEPNVVTKKGLEYWKTANRLVSSRSGIQYVYVDPVNGRDETNVNNLLGDPPILGDQDKPVKTLRAAANYATAAYSAGETVEFRIGPGVYLESDVITFSSKTRIRAWDFGSQGYLNDSKAGGTKPFMGQASDGKSWDQTRSYYLNPSNHPVFLIRARVLFRYTPTRPLLDFVPLTLEFKENAEVTGVVWWGSMETITNNNVPDSFFVTETEVDWRTPAKNSPDDALNHLILAEFDTPAASSADQNVGIYHLRTSPCIKSIKELSMRNIVFGAMSPADTNIESRSIYTSAIIETTKERIRARGVWLAGNTRVSSNLTDAPKLYGNTTYEISGFHEAMFGTDHKVSNADQGVILNFDGYREIEGGTGSNPDYNFTWNNVHLVNNSMAYSTTANDTGPQGTNWKTIGPALKGFFGSVKFIGTARELHWHIAFLTNSPGNRQGFVGKFGCYRNAGVATNIRTRGLQEIVSGFVLNECVRFYFFRKAGTDDEPTNANYPQDPGEVGTLENFDPLNAQVTPIRQGVDVVRPLTAFRDMKL